MKYGGAKFHRNFYQLLRRVLDTMGLNVTGHEHITRKTKHWKVQDHQGLLLRIIRTGVLVKKNWDNVGILINHPRHVFVLSPAKGKKKKRRKKGEKKKEKKKKVAGKLALTKGANAYKAVD